MKVIIVGGFRFPFGDAGGARCRLLSVELARMGIEVVVISQLPSMPRQEDSQGDGTYMYRGVRYMCSVAANTFQRSYLKSASNILRASVLSAQLCENEIRKKGADAVLFTGNFNLYLLPLLRVARRWRVPIIGEALEWFSPFVFYGGVAHPLAWDHEVLMRVTNRCLDGMVAISTLLESYYHSAGLDTLLMPSLCEPTAPLPPPPECSVFRFGYFGTPSIKDGIDEMIRSIQLLAERGCEFEFLLAGDDGRSGNLARIRKRVGSSDLLSKRIRLLGRVAQEDIPTLFRQCHALVLARPNMRFARAGLPQKLAEYMSMGRAVIVTDVGDITHYVRHGEDGLVAPPSDCTAFTQLMEEMLLNRPKCIRMGTSAHKRAQEAFSAELHARRFVELLSRVIAKWRLR